MRISTLKPLDPATLPAPKPERCRTKWVAQYNENIADDTEAGYAYRNGAMSFNEYSSQVNERIARDRARHFEQVRERQFAENEARYRADPVNQEANHDQALYNEGIISHQEYAQRVRDRRRAIREQDLVVQGLRARFNNLFNSRSITS